MYFLRYSLLHLCKLTDHEGLEPEDDDIALPLAHKVSLHSVQFRKITYTVAP